MLLTLCEFMINIWNNLWIRGGKKYLGLIFFNPSRFKGPVGDLQSPRNLLVGIPWDAALLGRRQKETGFELTTLRAAPLKSFWV